jgi:hypothetical protein
MKTASATISRCAALETNITFGDCMLPRATLLDSETHQAMNTPTGVSQRISKQGKILHLKWRFLEVTSI